MPDLTLTLGQLKITPLFWGLGLAFVISSFSMWRRLGKEGYREEDIFSTNLLMLLSSIAFGRLALIFVGAPEIGCFWGAVLIMFWRLKAMGKNIWEGLDCLALPWLYFLFLSGIGYFLTNRNFFYLGYSLVGFFGFFLYRFLKSRYRRFSWYKSGKIGFMFWAISFYGFFSLLTLDFLLDRGLYLNKLLIFISFFVSAAVIYYRAETKKK